MENALLKPAAISVAGQPFEPVANDNGSVIENQKTFYYGKKDHPVSLLHADDAAEIITKLILAKDPFAVCHTAFEPLDCDNKSAARLANKILEAKISNGPLDLREYVADSEYTWREARDVAEEFFEAIKNEDDALLDDIDSDDLQDEIANMLVDEAFERDSSSFEDLFPSRLTAEIALVIMPPDMCLDDYMLCQGRAGWSGVELNERSVDVLARCGHRLGDYRRHSGNKSENYDRKLYKPWMPLATLDELKELANEACSSYFNVIIYAQVPIRDIYKADFAQPITLSQYSLASWNFINGTFHDITKKQPLIIPPGLGRWVIPGETGYSPDDICGLSSSYYEAGLRNG